MENKQKGDVANLSQQDPAAVKRAFDDAIAEVIVPKMAKEAGLHVTKRNGEMSLTGTPLQLLAMLRKYAKD